MQEEMTQSGEASVAEMC